ncbi:MAG: acetylglutamate kinase [Candidatus Fischerbacteria bacterium RBG_13_37_8]|uniref:acetylglutamate kinase n=1 Tax=Candidatus Fischerbacteria bacterium RBG_13_37_8 TaxID=1817863 RepID=A0A1F5VTM7_9BACT|nr:MAG: acetylglutamate kinase [Candidatus Fischerbacteria bacterium RBG_13_37_8]
MKKYDVIINFLRIIDADRASIRYMKLFRKGNPARFAVVKLGGAVVEHAKAMIAVDLAYLYNLDLFPIVIHGGGTQIDKALTEAGMVYNKKDGLRITTAEQLPVIKQVLDRVNNELIQQIHEYGGRAVGFTENIFISRRHHDDSLGYVGEVAKVHAERIVNAIKNKTIPVVSCIGTGENGHYYNINADEAARAMVLAIKPKKYIIITEEGGIKNIDGTIISNICLNEEAAALEKNGIVSGGMLLKVKEAHALLGKIKYHLPVQITSSKFLLKELFSDKGKGTFIKLGAEIMELSNWNKISRERIKKLVVQSFGRNLKNDYFDKPVRCIFLDRHYHGMAVIRKIDDTYYLDKFCVSEEAQGQGIAQDIWRRMIKKFPFLFWRSTIENPINSWYFQKAQGALKLNKWILFWINLTDKQIKTAHAYVDTLEETLEERQKVNP